MPEIPKGHYELVEAGLAGHNINELDSYHDYEIHFFKLSDLKEGLEMDSAKSFHSVSLFELIRLYSMARGWYPNFHASPPSGTTIVGPK